MDRTEARARAEELVARMTPEEKISQLRYNAPAIERLGIPAYNWWNEALHGVARAGTATSFPQAIGMAASFDEAAVEQAADAAAEEGRAKYNAYSQEGDRDIYKGLTFWSPNVNIFRDPRWGRGQETYGEDPYLAGTLGCAYVRGLQGSGGSGAGEYLKTAACAKHFAVHSGPEAVRHSFDAKVGEKDLWETYLPAFERLVREAGVEAVMGAYNRTNGEPCCGSPTLIGRILRERWGFAGHFVSDCWAIRDFHENHRVTGSPEESAALAMNAGCDLNCGNTFLHLYDAFRQGLVSEERITEAAVRLFTTRFLLGLFDETQYDEIPYLAVECPEHLALSEKIAAEGMVLLKNNGILPLKKEELASIGVIGPNANSRACLVGNYHGTATEYITVLDGILRACEGTASRTGDPIRILYSEGCDLKEDRVEHLAFENDRLSEAMIVARHSDVVILVTGLDEHLEGEEGDTGNSYASGDKLDLLLPPPQRALMNALEETGAKVILVNISGSAIDLSFAQEHFDAVIQAWYPGARGGKALSDILFGEVSPSGKLPVTFYHDEDPLPDFTDYSMRGRTYRYLKTPPLYPFGYGLTYSDVRVTGAALATEGENGDAASEDAERESMSGGSRVQDRFTLLVTCENRGEADTDEVLQVYVEPLASAYAPDHPRLCGFARVHLRSGKSAAFRVGLDPLTYTVVNEAGERVDGGGRYALYAGTGQPDARTRELTGKECIRLEV